MHSLVRQFNTTHSWVVVSFGPRRFAINSFRSSFRAKRGIPLCFERPGPGGIPLFVRNDQRFVSAKSNDTITDIFLNLPARNRCLSIESNHGPSLLCDGRGQFARPALSRAAASVPQ